MGHAGMGGFSPQQKWKELQCAEASGKTHLATTETKNQQMV